MFQICIGIIDEDATEMVLCGEHFGSKWVPDLLEAIDNGFRTGVFEGHV